MNDLQIPPLTAAMIASSRGRQSRRRHTLLALMLVLLALGFLLTLMAGQTFTPLDEAIRVLAGDKVQVEMTPYDLTKGRITYRFK